MDRRTLDGTLPADDAVAGWRRSGVLAVSARFHSPNGQQTSCPAVPDLPRLSALSKWRFSKGLRGYQDFDVAVPAGPAGPGWLVGSAADEFCVRDGHGLRTPIPLPLGAVRGRRDGSGQEFRPDAPGVAKLGSGYPLCGCLNFCRVFSG